MKSNGHPRPSELAVPVFVTRRGGEAPGAVRQQGEDKGEFDEEEEGRGFHETPGMNPVK